MSDVLNNSEDLTKRMKEGLTFIDDRNNQLRYADKDEFIQWSQPLSSYRAALPIKRGLAVSVATEADLKEAGLKYFNNENYFLNDDPYSYIVPTDTSKHTRCIGLAHEPVTEEELGKKLIHVQGFGSFTYNKDLDSEEIENGLVYDPGFTYKDVGKKVYVANAEFDGVEPGSLTVNESNIYKTYNNFILLGYLTDAPVKNSDQVETKIEIAIQGDDRGPIDNTILEGVLGEDVLVPSSDPCRVFALGSEEDVAFKSKIVFAVHPNYNYNPKTSFIGFQKMDGETVLVTFSDEFSIAEVQNSMVQEDAAFLAIAKLYNDALNKNLAEGEAEHTIKIVKADLRNTLDADVLNLSKASLENAFKTAWMDLTGVNLNVSVDNSNVSEGVLCFDIESSEPGGYYYMYISNSAEPLFEDSVTFHNGSSYNKGTVVTADCRLRSRQNIIGVWYNNKLDEVVPKGTICLFMHDGLFTHKTNEYQELGKEYFLGRNGRVIDMPLEAYDTIVKVLDVQDSNKLLIHCDNVRRRDDTGDLPVGYMKPAPYCGESPAAEYGFLLMDGETRYAVASYEKLLTRLKAWFPESKLNIGKYKIGEDDEGNPIYEEEDHFIIPKCTSSTEYSEYNIMQIKAADSGIYESTPRIPYIRKFGNFFDAGDNNEIQINGKLPGIAYPQIAKYSVHNPRGISAAEKDYVVDDRFDISAICDLCTKIDGVEDPTLENLDIHLYIDPEYGEASRTDGLYHWVEIRSGFSSFNNTTTYGFEWKIEKEVANSVNIYSTYYLSTDIKDGMGIYYQTSSNVVPTSMAGKPWKIVVSRRETLKQQFDLNGVISAYLKNKILDENNNPYTTKAVTGLAVLDAIETRYNVKKLVARKDIGEILIGKEDEPTKTVNIAAKDELPIKSDTKIRFGIGLPEGLTKNQFITYEASDVNTGTETYTIENFIINASVDDHGNQRNVTPIALMPDNALVTKAQVLEHENKNAVKPNEAVNPNTVHGMNFGIGGNIDASKLNNLYLATHNSTQLKSNDVINSELNKTTSTDESTASYIPYRYYGDDPLGEGKGQRYITSSEGIEVHQNDSLIGTEIPFYSSEQYKVNETNTGLSHIETIAPQISTFDDIKGIKGRNAKIISKYNFGITDEDNKSISFIDENGLPINITAGNIGVGSKVAYKNVYGEAKQNLTSSDLNNAGGFNYTTNLMTDDTQDDYIGSALQAAYEMPLAFWRYKNEPSWYKKYIGIIIERVNDARDNLSGEDKRDIFNSEDLDWGSTQHYTEDNTFNYTSEELKSIKNYLNAITDNAENTQSIISSVGLLLKAAKETQERLLKVEASTFGSDATTIPGNRDKIELPNFPEVTPEATHLGLNRLIRAMSLELYGTADPLNDLNGKDDNSTQTSFSRIDELEKEIEGATFDKDIKASSSDNNISMLNSSTYPYEINETHKGNDDGQENNIDPTIYDPITGRAKKEAEEETADLHSNWSKVDLEKDQTFEKDGDTFKSNTENNLVPENERYEFNGLIDALARICTKVNALTYTVNGTDNIDSTPRRLNTIRANIGTLIREAYFDGEPTTNVENGVATTQNEVESERYKDLDIAEGVEQSSKPYEQKSTYTGLSRFDQLSRDLYNYVLTTRHDEHNYTLNGENITEDGKTSEVDNPIQYREGDVNQVLLSRKFNGKNLLISGIGKPIHEEGKTEYNRTGEITSEDTLVNNVNGSAIQNKNVSVQINIPDSIEEYNYASIIDVLIDAIGPAYFRQIYDNTDTVLSEQTLRDTRTITTRLEKIESELDNVVRKLCQKSAFETDTNKSLNDDTLSTDYGDDAQNPNKKNKTYSIEEFIFVLNKWLGLSVFGKDNNAWDVQRSAELAAGYDDSLPVTYIVNTSGDTENVYIRNADTGEYELVEDASSLASDIITYKQIPNNNYYLDTANPIVNANYVIKQLLKRLRETEHYDDAVKKILGKDYATDTALDNYTELRINADGTQNFDNIKKNYTLTDDVKDLLLTIYGTDSGITGSSENSAGTVQTNYQHRSNISTAGYLGSKEWTNESKLTKKLYTTLSPRVGNKVYTEDALKVVFGTIAEINGNAIVVSYNDGTSDTTAEYTLSKTTSEVNDNANTRFSGNGNTRNIIDDIVHEMYYVPQPVNYGDKALSDEAVEQSKEAVNDSINVNYATGNGKKHIYYDIDSGRYNYDYENQSHENTENEGRTGHAIGYNNRNTLFNDFLGNEDAYRKSRFEVLEDEIRHLRSLLGLDKIIDERTNDKISDSVASETKYGGKFLITGEGELAGHKFSANATRNGNLYTDNEASAKSPYGHSGTPNQDINLLTLIFNLDNAIKDISRELGTETNYHGYKTSKVTIDGEEKSLNYNNFEQLNLPREMSIYDRLNALEDITGSLLGLQNRATASGDGEPDNEDDDTTSDVDFGRIDIQWIEE